jgi:excisionase family DNA binding protein
VTSFSEDPKVAYSVKEVQQLLSLGRSTVYNLLTLGELRGRKVGSKFIIPKSAIEEFLQREGKINTRLSQQEANSCPN